MLTAVLICGVALLSGPTAPTGPTVPPPQKAEPIPYHAGISLHRFGEMNQRLYIDEFRREEVQKYREAVIAQRIALAEQLDQLIATNDCDRAIAVSQSAGYRDIRQGVARACQANASAAAR